MSASLSSAALAAPTAPQPRATPIVDRPVGGRPPSDVSSVDVPARAPAATATAVEGARVQAQRGQERAAREAQSDEQALRQAVETAARQSFEPRAVDVEGFFDEDSGRFVVKIADQESGEVLAQSPPDELLRYFAQARSDIGPVLNIDA